MTDAAKFVLSKKKVLEQYKIIKDLSDIVSFSAKTNYEVAQLLEESTDCMFSMHTGESINQIKDKNRIWFFGQGWNLEELKNLGILGIKNFVVDNENDLKILINFINENDLKINLLLRMRLKENTIHTGKYFVFGMYSSQINKFIPELRKNRNIDKLGIHFHRKTQNISEWSLKFELESVLSEETLRNIDFLNIGGGIPVKYKNFRADVVNSIFLEFSNLRKWLNNFNIKLIIEPGRFISGPPIILVTTIKNIYNNNIIVNCSVYNSAIDIFATHYRLEVENELEDGVGEAYTIKGQTPCSMDIFRYKVYLSSPKVGDKIRFLNAGAYNFSSDFCNLKKLKTEIVE